MASSSSKPNASQDASHDVCSSIYFSQEKSLVDVTNTICFFTRKKLVHNDSVVALFTWLLIISIPAPCGIFANLVKVVLFSVSLET
jgi:hypothetical protein